MDSNGPRPFDFMAGYPNHKPQQYMNLGFLTSPYPGKTGVGDYGPLQGGGIYYRPNNPVYPYPMDFDPTIPGPKPILAYAQNIPLLNRNIDLALHFGGQFAPACGRTCGSRL